MIRRMWEKFSGLPGGKYLFSKAVGKAAPYTGTIGAEVVELRPGFAKVQMKDKKKVRNHLNSIHAIALINLGELATGAAVMYQVDGRGRGILKGMSMEYTKKARGTITATCDFVVPEEAGKHDLEVDGILTDKSGDVVATARATWRIEIFE